MKNPKEKYELHRTNILLENKENISFRFLPLQPPPSTHIRLSHIIKKPTLRVCVSQKKMDRDSANAIRLRINRIALTRQLDAQELIPKLVRAHIISPDDDVQYINQGTSKIDRARRLIDCLLDENTEHIHRPTNWFLLFRNILLKNPDVYMHLVATLDHTRIPKSDSTQHSSEISFDQSMTSSSYDFPIDYSRHNQKQVTNIEFDRYAMNKVVIEGNFQKVIDNLTYYTQVCIIPCLFFSPMKIFENFRFLNNYSINSLIQFISMITSNFIMKNKLSNKCVVLN